MLLSSEATHGSIPIHDEDFLVLKQFLSSRNEALDDNKRLSFDRACLDLRNAASALIRSRVALASTAPPTSPVFQGGAMGFGPLARGAVAEPSAFRSP